METPACRPSIHDTRQHGKSPYISPGIKESFMRTITSNLKQAVFSRLFLAAALGCALVLTLSCTKELFQMFHTVSLLPFGYHSELVLNALSGSAMTLAFPILAALPYTAAIADDVKSGFLKEYLPRTTVRRYLSGKVIACAVSGGLALVFGMLLAWGALALAFLPKEAAPVVMKAADGSVLPVSVSPIWGKFLSYFASGALWATVGMLFANLTGSKYMAYASPFVLYYVLIILYERYFSDLYVLYPKEWLSPSGVWQYGAAGALLIVGELTVILALLAALAGKRRIGLREG